MFFAAKHYADMKVMMWVEDAMKLAMVVQLGVAKGTIQGCNFQILIDNIACNATKEIMKEKSILRCEPSIN